MNLTNKILVVLFFIQLYTLSLVIIELNGNSYYWLIAIAVIEIAILYSMYLEFKLNKERYFIISYLAINHDGKNSIGLLMLKSKGYPSSTGIKNEITIKILEIDKVVVTNIIELSKSDYTNFNK